MKRLIAALSLSALAVSADNVSWNVTDGDLSVPANWTGGILPADTNTIVFGQQGNLALTTSASLKNPVRCSMPVRAAGASRSILRGTLCS